MSKLLRKTKQALIAFLVSVFILATGSPALAAIGMVVNSQMTNQLGNENIYYGNAKGSSYGSLMKLQSNDGVNKFVIDRSGNVTANTYCDINGANCITPAAGGFDTTADWWQNNGNNTYTTQGNVGIGTNGPATTLDVNGNARFGSQQGWDNPGGWNRNVLIDTTYHGRFRIKASSYTPGYGNIETYYWADSSTSPSAGIYSSHAFSINANGNNVVFPSGNVGIGTTNPTQKLDVRGGIAADILNSYTSGDPLELQYNIAGDVIVHGSDSNLQVQGTGNSSFSGNVGIGTTGPGAKLHVLGGQIIGTSGSGASVRTLTLLDNSDGQINFGSYNGSWRSSIQIQSNNANRLLFIAPPEDDWNYAIFRSATGGMKFDVGGTLTDAGTNAITIDTSGNVGIGTASPGYKLDVAGHIRAQGNVYTNADYGYGLVGVYASTRYQGVFAMGDSWKLSSDGTSPGNLYGLAWTHTNVGGQSKAGLSHQLLVMENGVTKVALGSGIWTSGNVTAPTFIGNLSGYADSASKVNGYASNPDNSHPGSGLRPFYSWNIGQAYNSSSGYSNGITVGSHPGDPNYGFQIVQNMWDDQLYFRRYNYGWQGWRTVIDSANIGSQAVNSANYLNTSGLYYQGGNVGIGTTNPQYLLDISGGSDPNGQATLNLQATGVNSSKKITFDGSPVLTRISGHPLEINNGGMTRFLGSVSVQDGDNSYANFGPNSTWGGSLLVGAGTNQGLWQTAQIRADNGNLHIDSADATSNYHLYFATDQQSAIYMGSTVYVNGGDNSGTYNFWTGYTFYVNGNSYSTGGWSGSDVRWKKEIAPLQDSLSKILALKGVNYYWNTKDYPDKNFSGGKQIGLIAQDVKKVIPELVSADLQGYEAISYEKLTAVLVEAAKEQQKQIEELRQSNQDLQTRLEKLEQAAK